MQRRGVDAEEEGPKKPISVKLGVAFPKRTWERCFYREVFPLQHVHNRAAHTVEVSVCKAG